VLPFRATDTGLQSEKEEVTRLRYSRTLRTGAVAMRSFNFEKTQLTLEATSKADADTDYVDYDFDGRYFSEGSGKDLAKIKMESYAVARRTLAGASNCRHLTAGFKFGVDEHPRDDLNGDYVLTRVTHRGSQPQAAGADGAGASGEPAYTNEFEAIPADVTFRPPQVTERGLVEGPQTATVTGPAGEEIHCDSHGRVKVKFHWDRYGKADDKATVWIRVGQSHRVGDIAIPRVGEEVIVDFLEGDPDQPVITGHVYNGTKMAPYALPGEKTKSSFKTLSSPGGGGFNELRFEDAAGSEEVYLHVQKDWNIEVLNDRTEDIKRDLKHKVGQDEDREVVRDRFRKVGRNEAVEIGADQLVKIKADRTEAVGGNESVKIDNNQTHEVEGNRTTKTGKDLTESAGGKATLTVGEAHEISVGAGQTISVKEDYSLEVKGDASVEVKGDHETSTKGEIKLDAKKDIEIASKKKIKIDGGDEIKIECGSASITLKKSGDIVIKGKNIDMKADSNIQMKGSKIAGN
jgi:type VI secretion system secreted protein VgrG